VEFFIGSTWVLMGESGDVTGDYLQVRRQTFPGPAFRTLIRNYGVGGALRSASRSPHSMLMFYLTWGEPPCDVAAKSIPSQKAASSSLGMIAPFGLRVHIVVARNTESRRGKIPTIFALRV